MLEVLANGGPITWAVIVWALVLYGFTLREIGLQRARFAAALWAGLAGLLLVGLFGTLVGFIEAGSVPVDQFARVASIAVTPLAVAAVLGIPAALLTGVSLGLRTAAEG